MKGLFLQAEAGKEHSAVTDNKFPAIAGNYSYMYLYIGRGVGLILLWKSVKSNIYNECYQVDSKEYTENDSADLQAFFCSL